MLCPLATGRPKGVPNKTTEAVKQIYLNILSKEQKYWPKILEGLRNDNPYQYMMVMDKLSNKVIANKKDITTDGERIPQTIVINEIRKK